MTDPDPMATAPMATAPIAEVRWRESARVQGRVQSMRIHPVGGVTTLECVVVDDTGGIYAVFPRRRAVDGVGLGRELVLEGRVESHRGHLAMVDPTITIAPASG